jgi:hypothetical protein
MGAAHGLQLRQVHVPPDRRTITHPGTDQGQAGVR